MRSEPGFRFGFPATGDCTPNDHDQIWFPRFFIRSESGARCLDPERIVRRCWRLYSAPPKLSKPLNDLQPRRRPVTVAEHQPRGPRWPVEMAPAPRCEFSGQEKGRRPRLVLEEQRDGH